MGASGDVIGALSDRVGELSKRVASLEAELDAARQRAVGTPRTERAPEQSSAELRGLAADALRGIFVELLDDVRRQASTATDAARSATAAAHEAKAAEIETRAAEAGAARAAEERRAEE